jgi:hypothetical protein
LRLEFPKKGLEGSSATCKASIKQARHDLKSWSMRYCKYNDPKGRDCAKNEEDKKMVGEEEEVVNQHCVLASK